MNLIDIGSKCEYPASELSNFAAHLFVFDGVECASMEGLLQSFRIPDFEKQKEMCKLVGFKAKKAGFEFDWRKTQTLHWNGIEYKRDSKEYQDLLDRAYAALGSNKGVQEALKATGDDILSHPIGKTDIRETILTRSEFCTRLTKLRKSLV